MRFIFLMLVLVLSACASNPPEVQAVDQMLEWRNTAHKQALDGSMKWSDYYIQYFDQMQALPPSPNKSVEMRMVSELIPTARKYEAGELTKDQFYDIRRIVGAKYQEQHDNIQRADRQDNIAMDSLLLQQFGNSLRPTPTVNCTTTRLPGSYSSTTNCR